MAQLRIKRQTNGITKGLPLYSNYVQIGYIEEGDTKIIELEAGKHELTVQIPNMFRQEHSVPYSLQLAANEHKEIELVLGKQYKTAYLALYSLIGLLVIAYVILVGSGVAYSGWLSIGVVLFPMLVMFYLSTMSSKMFFFKEAQT